jgi:hypothetical protein
MNAEGLLQEISDYCRKAGMAETTFGRRAVNDGKFAGRLRYGGRVTRDTVERVRSFISSNPAPAAALAEAPALLNGVASPAVGVRDPLQNFRFYDNRQKYLMFVNTCSEKWIVAGRAALELANIHPRPPAVRLFDAGVGDGTVLTRVMRAMHRRFALMPFYIVGKEISLEDVRLALEKMPDRFTEHPATVLVMTNLNYAEAPWLTPASIGAATGMVWQEVALAGNSAAEFEEQITALQPFLARHWRARISKTSGNPVYEQPVALVLYREDCRFLLDQVKPQRGAGRADYDLVIASQPYRARASVDFKARRVLAPLARSLAPGGRLIGIHSYGDDPGLEIVRLVWPDQSPHEASTSTPTPTRGRSSATTCTPCLTKSAARASPSAPRPCWPPGTPPPTSRRSRTSGWVRRCATPSIWMPRATSSSGRAACGSGTNPTSSRASAIWSEEASCPIDRRLPPTTACLAQAADGCPWDACERSRPFSDHGAWAIATRRRPAHGW